jgi:hypothetical protein
MQSLAATPVVVEGKSCGAVRRERKSCRAFAEKKKRSGEPALRGACYS